LKRTSTRKNWESYWGGKAHSGEVYSNADRIARNLAVAGLKPGDTVLEVGAGTGRDSEPLADHGAVVYLLDYSYESIRLIRQTTGGKRIFPVGGDAFSLPFRDGTFDAVYHQGLLEHFREEAASRMIREQTRVLKPGGLLLIDVPQRYHIYTLLKHLLIMANMWFAGWERSFSYPELKGLMRAHGLSPVHRYGEWMVPSLLYRVVREIFKSIGVSLPLYPREIPAAASIRRYIRTLLLKTFAPLYTGISIGIVARKPESE
jgi:SAM-dependent methyltransferase